MQGSLSVLGFSVFLSLCCITVGAPADSSTTQAPPPGSVAQSPNVFYHAASVFLVGAVWGCTNPLISRGGAGIEKVHGTSKTMQVLLEVWFLLTSWRFIVPWLLNQSGSFLYWYTLGEADLSLASPIANAVACVFSFLVGRLLGEKRGNAYAYWGVTLIMAGVVICTNSKMSAQR